TRVHVQLLSAGQGRAFRPWISLVQMARAYGQWVKERPRSAKLPSVVVYVVTPDVVALLNAGQLHLAEHLQDALIRINVEIIDGLGMAQTHQEFVDAKDRLGDLTVFSKGPPVPRVHAVPSPHAQSGPKPLDKWMRKTELRDFGLVSGSTLVVDYSKRQP
ncbi:MAG TPA: hypothetical protein VK745_30735, partial [Polyangiaceae bacterium]|nr:hypothetical protein [Polyangiaceae bacterium]